MSNESPGNPTVHPQQDLPPKRKGKAVKRTSAPLYKTPLNNFIYALATIAVFILAFYTYKITSWKNQAGGWWNLATGQREPTPQSRRENNDVRAKISDLASAFGIPPATLATAIASAVSAHATQSSATKKSEASQVAESFVQEDAAAASESVNGFVNKLSNVVGFDDAGAELD